MRGIWLRGFPMQPSPRHSFAREPAFTLIEVLVVLVVLASLAGIGLTAAQGARAMAETQQARADLARIAAAIESTRTHLGRYPASADPASLYATLTGRADVDGRLLANAGRRLLEPAGLRLALPGEAEPNNYLVDPWGRAYVYTPPGADLGGLASPFHLYSAGPDTEPGRHRNGEPDATDLATADNLYAFR